MRLRTRFFISIFSVILVIGVAGAVLGFFIIQRDIVARSQEELIQDLGAFRLFYDNEIEQIGVMLKLIKSDESLEPLKKEIGLDYLVVSRAPISHPSPVVRAAALGRARGGSRVMRQDELAALNPALASQAQIPIVRTQKARPTERLLLEDALVIEYAMPINYSGGSVTLVLYGGKVINRNIGFIDKIHAMVFKDELYDGKPLGTATIFLDDVRITTNVLNAEKKRAIGTLVSAAVYDKVLAGGEIWRDRAFVVTDWYLTAYEPIVDIDNNRIGILYVGRLEKPFFDMTMQALFLFAAILAGTALLGAILTFFLAQAVSRPLTHLITVTQKIAQGHYSHKISASPKVYEIAWLASAFNNMVGELEAREKSLHDKSETLSRLNKSYLDLIGFVSHELKGILSSAILNAYTVRDGFLGMINFKQRKALDSITRNLDYLAETVKNFLNLSRIEKGELELRKETVNLKNDVLGPALESFEKTIQDRELALSVSVPDDLEVCVDRDLFLIVLNNLISNAIKYGRDKGRIVITAKTGGDLAEAEVYNDGDPLPEAEREKLFGKFVRLEDAKKRHIKGTGLGLFITREIVENHGGTIGCQARPDGNAFIFTFLKGSHDETA